MKKILKYIAAAVFAFCCCSPQVSAEQISDNVYLSDRADYNQYAFDRFLQRQEEKENGYTFYERAILLSRYFNNRYEGDKIEEDFTEDVAQIFPSLSPQGVIDAEKWIRRGVKLYRWGEKKYQEIYESIFSEPELPILPDEAYDLAQDREYIPSENKDEYVVITDIKRVLSYGDDPQDKAMMEAKRNHDLGIKTESSASRFAKIKKLWDEKKYKELFFFGTDYEQEAKYHGIGSEDTKENVLVRIMTNYEGSAYPDRLKAGIDVILPHGYFVPAENSGEFFVPKISLEKSENLLKSKVYYPMPQRFNHSGGKSFGIYSGNFLIPVEIEVDKNAERINLKADVKMQVCNTALVCKTQDFSSELTLKKEDILPSMVNTHIEQAFYMYPIENEEKLLIKKAQTGKDKDKNEYIKIKFEAKKSVSSFDVFVEDESGTEFETPKIAVNGKEVSVMIFPADKTQKLTGEKIRIRASLNDKYNLEKEEVLTEASMFDVDAASLSFGLIILGFLGGFLLNFMPCVFPVLSIKIIAMRKMNNQTSKKIKKSFLLSGAGIVAGFLLLTLVLEILKLCGQSLGWGMQFQNYIFLMIMSFVCTLLLAQFYEFIEFETPKFVNKIISSTAGKEDFASVSAGLLVVLMATPCSAPFLGTAIGFALGGSFFDMFLIMTAVGLGLASPYFLVSAFPNVSLHLPKDAKYQKKAHLVISMMLIATILWLLWLLGNQISTIGAVAYAISLLLFFKLMKWRKTLVYTALNNAQFADNREKAVKSVKVVSSVLATIVMLLGALFVFSSHKAGNSDSSVELERIREEIADGKTVLLEISADWCLTCSLNNIIVLNDSNLEIMKERYNLVYIKEDWSAHNDKLLEFMAKYQRRGLPFYVVYSQSAPEGIVLPEILTLGELESILDGINTF